MKKARRTTLKHFDIDRKKHIRYVPFTLLTFILLATACGKNDKTAQDSSTEPATESSVETTTSSESSDEVLAADSIKTATEEAAEVNPLEDQEIELNLSELPETLEPCGLYADGDALLITDSFSKKIWKVTTEGAEVIAGADSVTDIYEHPVGGYNDATAEEALFREPWAIVRFLDGYTIADTENDALRQLSSYGVETVNARNADGKTAAKYDYPTGLATDDDGCLYVADTHSNRILRITTDGVCTPFIKGLESPMGLCYSQGYLFIAETGANRIVKVAVTDDGSEQSSDAIEIVAGSGEEGSEDGQADAATFSSPKGVHALADGTVYVADTVNGAVRKIADGQVSTLEIQYDSDNDMDLTSPIGICALGGKLYVADNFGRKVYVIIP